ncbi:hypothetical protein [Streptomyces sp. NPDC004250]|uniref:hypothetical protein n=1 Tax=Streptomyces sp. NPDC004250 TaxID=3364692 RepID=UPI0036AE41A0
MALNCVFMVYPTRPDPRIGPERHGVQGVVLAGVDGAVGSVVDVVGEGGVRRPVAGGVAVGERDQGLGHVSVRARAQVVGGDLETVDQRDASVLGAGLDHLDDSPASEEEALYGRVLPPLQVAGAGQGPEERLGRQISGLAVGGILAVLGGLAQLAKISEPGPDAGDDSQVEEHLLLVEADQRAVAAGQHEHCGAHVTDRRVEPRGAEDGCGLVVDVDARDCSRAVWNGSGSGFASALLTQHAPKLLPHTLYRP